MFDGVTGVYEVSRQGVKNAKKDTRHESVN